MKSEKTPKEKKPRWEKLKQTFSKLVALLKQAFSKLAAQWKLKIVLLFISGAIVLILMFPEHEGHNMLLRYLSLLLSWPVVVFVLIIIISFIFKEPIEAILSRLTKIKVGQSGAEFTQPQPAKDTIIKKEDIKLPSKVQKGAEKPYTSDDFKNLQNQIALFQKIVTFERIVRYIYRSQVQLLKALKNNSPMSFKIAIRNYFLFLSRGGKENYTAGSYITWLKSWGLIDFEFVGPEYMISLTPHGDAFLTHCNISNYTDMEFTNL